MDETTFWQMIKQAKADSGGDDEEQVKLLVERLSLLEISEIVDFDYFLAKFENQAYRCDICDAANIIAGGLGDDGFSDFRAWLVAQGKDIYEQVLSNPDWLAQVVTVVEGKYRKYARIELESMIAVAWDAYELKTGEDYLDMPSLPVERIYLNYDWTPEEEKPLKFPNLWALFGNDRK